MQLTPLDSK